MMKLSALLAKPLSLGGKGEAVLIYKMCFFVLNSSMALEAYSRSMRVNLRGRDSPSSQEYFSPSSILSQDTLFSAFWEHYVHKFCCKCHNPMHFSKGSGRNGGSVCAPQCPDALLVLFLLSRKRRFTMWPFLSLVFKAPLILYVSAHRAISIKTTMSAYGTMIYRPVTWCLSTWSRSVEDIWSQDTGGHSLEYLGQTKQNGGKKPVSGGLDVEQCWQQIPIKPFNFIPMCGAVYIQQAKDKDLFPTPT